MMCPPILRSMQLDRRGSMYVAKGPEESVTGEPRGVHIQRMDVCDVGKHLSFAQ